MVTRSDLEAALPTVTGITRLLGIEAPVEVYRDRFGIPHVRASTELDAFFAQGFVSAADPAIITSLSVARYAYDLAPDKDGADVV